jgi:hypothetical protein
MNLTHSPRRSLLALTVATAGIFGGAAPASASTTAQLTLQAVNGTAHADGTGTFPSVEVTYPSSKRPRTVPGSFSLGADDGTFPAAEVCEPATAVVEIGGDHRTQMTLSATGTVCGRWAADETATPIQNFVGRYTVVDGPARFAGDDGFLNIMLGEGWSYLFAIDT